MKKRKIRSVLLAILPLIAFLVIGLSTQYETAKADDEICDTWDDWAKICHGQATNCFCAIIVEPEK
jgi:hypothetical protein